MANIVVTTTEPVVSVNSTTNQVNVTQSVSNVIVSATATVPSSTIRDAISVTDNGGDGSLSYSNASGVISYTGPSAAEVRAHLSNTSPILYNASSGVISIDSSVLLQDTFVDLGTTSGNLAVNSTAGDNFKVVLNGNLTGFDFTGEVNGDSYTFVIIQDAVGGRQIDTTTHSAFWSNVKFANDYKTLDTNPNNWNIISMVYDGTTFYASLVVEEALGITNSDLANSNVIVNGTTIALGSSGNISNFGSLTTNNLTENTNLYYTNARSRAALSVTQASASGAGTLGYNNGTGVFTYTPPDLTAFGLTNAQVITHIATVPLAVGGNLSVTGNIDATGNINYQNVTDLFVRDQKITLNANATTDATVEIISNRPQSTYDAKIVWNEPTETWTFMNGNNVFQDILTTAQTRGLVSVSSATASGNGSVLYNASTGVFSVTPADTSLATKSTSNLSEGTNLYYTDARFDTRFGTKTTANLTENTNLYYTDARSRAAVSVSTGSPSGNGSLAYNSGTGVFTFTPADIGGSTYGDANVISLLSGAANGYPYGHVIDSNANITTSANINSAGGIFTGDISLITASGQPAGIMKGDLLGPVLVSGYNNSASQISAGFAIYFDGGSHLGVGNVAIADYDTASKMPAVGVSYHHGGSGGDVAFAANSLGNIVVAGEMYLPSHGLTVGADIYVENNGLLTSTKPTGTNLIQKIGVATTANAIVVQGSFDTELENSFAGKTTDNLTEGSTNLYFTNARANSAIQNYTGNMENLTGQITTTNIITGSGLSTSGNGNIQPGGTGAFVGDARGLINTTIPTGGSTGTNASAKAWIETGSNSELDVNFNIKSNANITSQTFIGAPSYQNLTGSGAVNIGDSANADSFHTRNYVTSSQQWQKNLDTTELVLSTESLGYSAFIPRAENPVNGSGGVGARQNDLAGAATANAQPLLGYIANATVTAGNTQVVVTGITRLYQYYAGSQAASTLFTDASNITTILGEIAINSVPKTGSQLAMTQAPFAKGTYITGVDAANKKITVSEAPVGNATLVAVDNAFATNQNPLWIGAGAFNTEVKYAEMYVSYADRLGNIADANYYPYYTITSTLDQFGADKNGFSTSDLTYTTNNPASWTAATYSTSGKTALSMPQGAISSPGGMTIGNSTSTSFKMFNDLSGYNFGLNVGWDGGLPGNIATQGGTIIPQIGIGGFADNTVGQMGNGSESIGPRILFQNRKGNVNISEFDQYPRSGAELGRIQFYGTHGDNINPSTVAGPGYISFTAADDWTDGSNTNAYFVATSNYTDTTSRDPFLSYEKGELIIASGQPTSVQADIRFAPAVQIGSNPQNAYDFSSDAAAAGSKGWASMNYANVTATSGAKFSVNNGMSLGAGTVGDQVISIHRNDNSYALANGTIIPTAFFVKGTAGLATDTVGFTSGTGALPRGVDVTFSGVTQSGWTFLNGNTYVLTDVGFGAGYSGLTQSGAIVNQGVGSVEPISPSNAAGQYEFTNSQASGVTDKEWSLTLAEQSEDLVLKGNTTTQVTFTDARTIFNSSLKLKSYTTTEINALASPQAGDSVYNSTLNQICFYNGTAWQKVTSANM